MKALVIFDSAYGNTKKIAESIAEGLGNGAKAVFVSDFERKMLEDIDLLIVGSPINGWRPLPSIAAFLDSLGADGLKGIKATSFDTRVKPFIHGDAMKKIASKLKKAGAQIITDPKPFYVKGKEGPLFEGEVENAKEWGESIAAKLK